MTMIACTISKTPVIIGDILISSSEKSDKFILPVLIEDDVLQYLYQEDDLNPVCFNQKIYILKSNVCIAFSGDVFHFKKFLEDVSLFCKVHNNISAEKIDGFLKEHEHNKSWEEFSFVILVMDKETNSYRVGRCLHGNWLRAENNMFGEVFSTGSGSLDFLEAINESVKMISHFPTSSANYTLQVNIITICRLLAAERRNLNSIKKHWGAGFEMIYFDKDEFTKVDNITYIINFGKFDEEGEIPDVPIPYIILHYQYHGDILVISVFKPHQGTTDSTKTEYIIKCENLERKTFVVVPINYSGTENFEDIATPQSFVNSKIAMGYILETEDGTYQPASINDNSSELTIEYNHPKVITLKMLKSINDILVNEAKAAMKDTRTS